MFIVMKFHETTLNLGGIHERSFILEGGVGLEHGGDEGDDSDELSNDGPWQGEVVALHVGPHDVKRVAAPLPQFLQHPMQVARL